VINNIDGQRKRAKKNEKISTYKTNYINLQPQYIFQARKASNRRMRKVARSY